MLYGANRPYNVALVVPDEAAVRSWAEENDIHLRELASDPRVTDLILRELRERSGELKSYEEPRKILLLSEDFTTENDLMTPTMKVKRRNIERRFGPQLDALYGEPARPAPQVARAPPP